MLYDKELISLDEANHILIFSHFSNPIFILTTVSVYFFHNSKMGILLLVIHYVSNIILGFIFRNKFCHNNIIYNNLYNYSSFGNNFINAIKRGIDTILMICGVIVIFLMLSTIVVDTFSFNIYDSMIIKGIFELTIGLEALGKLDISNCYKLVIASMFLAFGGISVHIQVFSQIANTKIKYSYFFMGRIMQMVISLFLSLIVYNILGI